MLLKKRSDSIYLEFTDPAMKKTDVSITAIRYYRGLSFYYLDSFKSALEDFNFFLQERYDLKNTYLYLGSIYCEGGLIEKGCSYLTKAAVLGNDKANGIKSQYCK